MRLGIDTGGTCTDAVLLDEAEGVVASAKALTSHHDLYQGIAAAVRAVLAAAPDEARERIGLVGLSTTLATNALVEGQGGRAGLIMVGFGPESLARGGLGQALGRAPVAFVAGGHDASAQPRQPLDLAALDAAIGKMAPTVDAFAVTATFAVRNPAHEQVAAERIMALTGRPVTVSSELTARLDAPRRALTTFLNARLVPRIGRLIAAVERLLAETGIAAPLMVVRGDGALMAAEVARRRPVETLLSGPAASVVGAAHLSGLRHAVISDVGGTTTDVALLDDGQPRLAPEGALVGGFRTMVEAVELQTSGLGGDSETRVDEAGRLGLGPRRLVPLALLADQHPQVLEALHAQAARAATRATDARFALRQDADVALSGLSRSQHRLLDLLAGGPCPLELVIDREHLAVPLKSLALQGIVRLAGFTPSDAGHVLGRQSGWSIEAARLGAQLEARKRGGGDTVERFAAAVLEAARTASARAVVGAVWEATGGTVGRLAGFLDEPPVAMALAGDEPRAPLAVRFTIDRPLVAVGGPAAVFYEGVAERLGSRLVLPAGHAVCNAIGAVVGEVARRVELVATRTGDDQLALHLGEAGTLVTDPASARTLLISHAEEAAIAAARSAGAQDPVVSHVCEERRVVLDGGLELLLEIRVRATARGRPSASQWSRIALAIEK
jgi:N-methylhydantoinase A/oxoprolinase/acetone carboxylase beta subunit